MDLLDYIGVGPKAAVFSATRVDVNIRVSDATVSHKKTTGTPDNIPCQVSLIESLRAEY